MTIYRLLVPMSYTSKVGDNMIKLDDTIIQADMLDILNTLKAELYVKGLERFNMFRPNGINIQTNCPFHKGGQERKPSFGINIENGKCHCFTCGWSGDITTLISELNGYLDEGRFGKRWLVKRFNSLEIEGRPALFTNMRGLKNNAQKPVISEEELDSYRYIHPYMYERELTDEIIEQFDIGYDQKRDCITFPIKDIEGDVVFVATRSTKSKFFGLPKGLNKPIYCAELFTSGKYNEAYIVESFFNCLTCWKYGKPAMALIGTGNYEQYKILERLPVRSYILALDPDEAGRKATLRFRSNVKGKIIKELEYIEEGKDINDLQEKFLDLRKIF